MNIVTYTLREGHSTSDDYYPTISAFTDEILAAADESVGSTVEDFMSYVKANGYEELRSKQEYIFEFLTLGTLWHVYGDDALELPAFPRLIMIKLAEIRQQNENLKQGIDALRSIMSTIFLSPDEHTAPECMEPTLEHLNKLLNWLHATGDFNQEVARLEHWREFLLCQPEKRSSGIIAQSIAFAAWFRNRSEETLGSYTCNVEKFLNERQANRQWREDVVSCGKQRVEYHLNMLGAEIMNRAFRDGFLKAAHKYVLIPRCMRLLPELQCKAYPSDVGFRCAGCRNDCRVHHITRLGKKHGFEALIIPHESSLFTSDKAKEMLGRDSAVVGIACVTTLVSGGWKAKGYDIPAQCVLLDYCGCKEHWHPQGIVTDINMDELKRILEVDADYSLSD